jgi:hypothetical protein
MIIKFIITPILSNLERITRFIESWYIIAKDRLGTAGNRWLNTTNICWFIDTEITPITIRKFCQNFCSFQKRQLDGQVDNEI